MLSMQVTSSANPRNHLEQLPLRVRDFCALSPSKTRACLQDLIEHFSSNHCEWDAHGILTAFTVQNF